MDPFGISIALGAAQAGLGLLGAGAEGAAAKQDYANQTAFQNANTQFARWQAGFNARVADANAQYNYWQETVNYNQNLAYSRSLRNYETLKAIAQADVVEQTRSAAGAAFVGNTQAINQQAAEASMREAVAQQQYQVAALKARGRAQASEQEGASIDRLLNDYVRQVGDYQTIQAINEGFRARQFSREQAAQVAEYLSRYNSQTFYQEQPYMEPVAPFAPLPALLEAPQPTMTGAGPSNAATALRMGGALLGGINTGFEAYGSLKKFTGSKPAPTPGAKN
jgi:hypothetical protein